MSIASANAELASLLQRQSRPAEAAPLYEDAVAMYSRLLGDRHATTALMITNLLPDQSAPVRGAEPLLLEAHRKLVALEGRGGTYAATTARDVATMYDLWGRPDEAARFRTQR